MSVPTDDIALVAELRESGFSECAIERYTNICRSTVRNILLGKPVETDARLSTRQRQEFLATI